MKNIDLIELMIAVSIALMGVALSVFTLSYAVYFVRLAFLCQ